MKLRGKLKNDHESESAIVRRDIGAGILDGAKAVVNEDLVWPFSWFPLVVVVVSVRTCDAIQPRAAH